ncbi:MAG: PilZ domain-containing protein [Desulfobacteraceae bacterium]
MNSLILEIFTYIFFLVIFIWLISNLIEGIKKFLSLQSPENEKDEEIENNSGQSINKRLYDRKMKNLTVEIKRNNGSEEIFKGRTKDISFMGAFIICRKRIEVNEKVQINFFIKNKNNISLDAKVVWSNTGMPEKKIIIPGFGVKFIDMGNEKRNQLSFLFQNT